MQVSKCLERRDKLQYTGVLPPAAMQPPILAAILPQLHSLFTFSTGQLHHRGYAPIQMAFTSRAHHCITPRPAPPRHA